MEKSFNQELRTLRELKDSYPHDHIVTHLTTWTQENKYCMIFPYAKCNMWEYMQRYKFDTSSSLSIVWILRQLRGLAGAVRHMHGLSSTSSHNEPGLRAADQINRAGWHHDLKPQNILYFGRSGDREESFRIADFGSSKIQTYRSGSIDTKTLPGTLTYEPPEAAKGPTSRPYDVWSLGCVFLELLVWAVQGHHEVLEFAAQRKAPRREDDIAIDDSYWKIAEGGRRCRRQLVDDRIKNLRLIIQEQNLNPFQDTLMLIERMLDLEASSRISALDTWDTLDRICRQIDLDMGPPCGHGRSSSNPSHRSSIRLSLNPPDRRSPDPSPSRPPSVTSPGSNQFLTPSPTMSNRSPRRHSQASQGLLRPGSAGQQ